MMLPEQIENVIAKAKSLRRKREGTRFPWMTYEEGVIDALQWVTEEDEQAIDELILEAD